jgi:hypothetical protein
MKPYIKNTFLLLAFLFSILFLEHGESHMKKAAAANLFKEHPEVKEATLSRLAGPSPQANLLSEPELQLSKRLAESQWRIQWGMSFAQLILVGIFGWVITVANRPNNSFKADALRARP